MGHNSILVTLIIPCFGVENYLRRCIKSALCQSHANLEIILVNDGSIDKTGEICDELAATDTRIKVIHKTNGGVSSARNAGLDAAKGAYLCFADADDWLEFDYVEYLLNLALSFDSDIALSDQVCISNVLNKTTSGIFNEQTSEVVSSAECIKRQFYYKIKTVAVFNKIYKSTLFGSGLRFNPVYFMGEGFNFNIRAYQLTQRITIGHKRVYWYFKENSESATSKFSMRHIENGLSSIKDMGASISSHDKGVIRAWRYAKYHTICDFYADIIRNNKKRDFPEQYKYMRRYILHHLPETLVAPVSPVEKIRPLVFAFVPASLLYKMFAKRAVHSNFVRK